MFIRNCFSCVKSLCLAIFMGCLLASNTLAQDASNKRGFQAGNSFAIGDFETINTTNGNLMLRFPLGSLPGGRNGLSAGMSLIYNSKLMDSETQYELEPNGSCEIVGDPGEGVEVCPYYQKTVLGQSTEGGWRLGYGYSLKLIDRALEYNSVPSQYRPQCWNQFTGAGPSELRYRYKLMVVFPDGSSHEMRPNGWSDGNGNDPLHDYFDIRPDGYWHQCTQEQWYTNTITYYSIDGSHLRLDIQHDGNTALAWWDNPWTLYLPDGGRVTSNQSGGQPQRIYDRNNNYVEFIADGLRDQFGRTLTMSTSFATGQRVDTITTHGFGEDYSWTVRWKQITGQKSYWPCRSLGECSQQILQRDNFGFFHQVVDTITLPEQAGSLTYQFTYNAPDYSGGPPPVANGWGELSGITLPSGAQITYTYAQDGEHPGSYVNDILRNSPVSKVVTYNEEYDGDSTPVTETWAFDISTNSSSVTAPDGGVTSTAFVETSMPYSNSGLTYISVTPDGTKTETIWQHNDLDSSAHINYYPKTVFTSIKNAAGTYVKTAIRDYKYDKNGNVTRTAEYDWVNYQDVPRDAQSWPTGVPNVSPTRVTVNTYYNATPDSSSFAGTNSNVYWSSGSPRVKNALASTEVRKIVSGVEQRVTNTAFTYDNPSTPANLIQTRTWDSTKGAYTNPLTDANSIKTSTVYNQYGMPTLATDPRGMQTSITYGDVGGGVVNLYATQIKTAYQTTVQRTETREYDFDTGLVTRVTDVDNGVATATTYDVFGRPLLVTAAEGKPEKTTTSYEYSDTSRRVITRSDLSAVGDGKLVSIQHFDQLGRVRLSRQLEDAIQSTTNETTGIKVQTRYRYSGANSFVLVSNAYRAMTSDAAASETTMGWTRRKSDNTGRTIEVQTFGGAGLPAPWGSSTTSTGTITSTYDANFTIVADQVQRQRRSVTDALGRLVRVDEPDASGNLGSTATPNQPTNYSYDVLGNLTRVTQSDGTTTQNRDFTYSSLSRLISASNPESGTISYQYDNNGNVLVKTDARTDPNNSNKKVSVHYDYDVLNRLTRRWYNGSSSITDTTHGLPTLPQGIGNTDEVRLYYDSQSLHEDAPDYSRGYAAGRLVAQTYGSGASGDYYAYDALGRTTLKYQRTGLINYQMSAVYNLAGAVTSFTYPSNRTITNTFDGVGRLSAFSGNLGNGTTQTYASGILYSANGALTTEQFGTTITVYNKQFYNSRGQLAEIRTGTSYTGPTDHTADRGSIVNNYSNQCSGDCLGSSMTDNNGNLKKQEIQIPDQQLRWQQYEYDSLNRLWWAREVLGVDSEQWKQQFVYDRWGNRTINAAVTYGNINEKAFTVNTSNNRLGVPSGQSGVMQYDAAGNLTTDTYTGAGDRTYDAENKIVSAWGGNNQAQLYSYDGSGQRIKRIVDGVETWHVYGFGGELLAEYPANGAALTPQKEYGYRNGQLLITAGTASQSTRQNFALRSNGSSASASSEIAAACSTWPARGAIDGDRKGSYWGNNGGWADSSSGSFSNDWFQVDFDSAKTIDELDIFTLQDDPLNPAEPTEAMTFSVYGLTAYSVSYWNGSAWINIPEASVAGNNKVWRKFTFAPITTTKLRVYPQSAVDNGYSRLTEVEAWGSVAMPAQTNVALRSNGGTATASSEITGGCETWPARGANDGDRKGAYWGGTGGWADANVGNFTNDWLQIEFSGSKTIHEIDLFTLQDNYANPVEPTESTISTVYGLTAFDVSYWNGSNWVQIPETVVSGNNKIWRKLTFSPITTTKIRVYGRGAIDNGRSRIVEVEAWSATESSGVNGLQWLVSDHLGTPRMVLDQTGSVEGVKRHDYLPFGEELFAPLHGRTTSQGYASGDSVRQQFTSKERDIETGLDYFLARYYSSIQGRFTSPDPTLLSVNGFNPQTWNRYTYVLNNPLAYVDPLGLWALQSETIYRTDKDGNYERDRRGRLIVERVVVTAVRTSDKDTGASLAKQLGLTGKSADAFAQRVGDGNNVRLSRQGGDVGRIFGAVEQGLKEQAKFEIEHPDRHGQGPNTADCSVTACRIAFPQQMFGTLTFSVQEADATISAQGATTSVQESNLRLGDIARWADARNNPQHFASFIFRNDDGVPVVFSKSGARGPYETVTTAELGTKYPEYGTIRGITSGQTGYYHPR